MPFGRLPTGLLLRNLKIKFKKTLVFTIPIFCHIVVAYFKFLNSKLAYGRYQGKDIWDPEEACHTGLGLQGCRVQLLIILHDLNIL